jgi:hypothetical protein
MESFFSNRKLTSPLAICIVVAFFGLMLWMLRPIEMNGDAPSDVKRVTTAVSNSNKSAGQGKKPASLNSVKEDPNRQIDPNSLEQRDLLAMATRIKEFGKSLDIPSLPNKQQISKLQDLIREVRNPKWPGNESTSRWVIGDEGTGPAYEVDIQQRQMKFNELVRLKFYQSLYDILNDPETRVLGARFITNRGVNEMQSFSQGDAVEHAEIEKALRLMDYRIGGAVPPPLNAIYKFTNVYYAGNYFRNIEQQVVELQVPSIVSDFVEDSVRAFIFEGAGAGTQPLGHIADSLVPPAQDKRFN